MRKLIPFVSLSLLFIVPLDAQAKGDSPIFAMLERLLHKKGDELFGQAKSEFRSHHPKMTCIEAKGEPSSYLSWGEAEIDPQLRCGSCSDRSENLSVVYRFYAFPGGLNGRCSLEEILFFEKRNPQTDTWKPSFLPTTQKITASHGKSQSVKTSEYRQAACSVAELKVWEMTKNYSVAKVIGGMSIGGSGASPSIDFSDESLIFISKNRLRYENQQMEHYETQSLCPNE